MLSKTIKLEAASHRNRPVVLLRFSYDKELIFHCKALGARWSVSRKQWYINQEVYNLKEVFNRFKGIAFVDYKNANQKLSKTLKVKRESPIKNFSQATEKEINAFVHILGAKGYAANTRATYKNMIEDCACESINSEYMVVASILSE